MKTMPDEIACAWVRDQLPLLGAADEPAPARPAGEGPTPEERVAVEAHLEACDDCRGRRDGLALALDALALAAADAPVEPRSASLWPALQSRMEAQERRREGRPKGPVERAAARLGGLRDELPLQLAWLGDSARERPDPDRVAAACDRLLRPLAGPAGVAAAAVLAFVAGVSLAGRIREESFSRIDAASAPLPQVVRAIPLKVTPPRAEAIEAPDAYEPSAPLELAVLDERNRPKSPVDAPEEVEPRAVEAARPAPAVVRPELERGTPMPPDSRVAKPAY